MRQISSSLTFFYKFVLPGLFATSIVNIGVMYAFGWFRLNEGLSAAEMLLMSATFLVVNQWVFGSIKKVSTDGDVLKISNYRDDVTVRISEIYRVTEVLFFEPRRITIHLKNPTLFGSKIVFLGSYRGPFAFVYSHPTVSELRHSVAKHAN